MKKIAPWLAVGLLVFVGVIAFSFDRTSKPKEESAVASAASPNPVVTSPAPVAPSAPPNMIGGTESSGGANPAGGPSTAPVLGDLVGRLEAKVASDPTNVGNQILLAQTYSELGRTDDGIKLLRKMQSDKMLNGPRVQLVLASLLSRRAQQNDLAEALKLLDEAVATDRTQTGFAQLYRGRIFVTQGKKDVAVKLWRDAIKKLDSSDPAKAQIEDELAKTK